MIDFLMLEYLTYATLHVFNAELLALLGNPPEALVQRSVWDGTIARLPDAWPVFVHASPHILCTRAELAAACKPLGHVPFYDNALVGADGNLYPRLLRPAVEAFLKTHVRRINTRARRKRAD